MTFHVKHFEKKCRKIAIILLQLENYCDIMYIRLLYEFFIWKILRKDEFLWEK